MVVMTLLGHPQSEAMWSKISSWTALVATSATLLSPSNVYSDPSRSMLWVAGGNCILNIHYNRYRGERCDLTLPYLTLNLVFIFLKYIILPYMNPTRAPNRPLKHTNPQFYIGNTDLTRRILWAAGALLGSKIHPVGPFLAQNNWQNLLF